MSFFTRQGWTLLLTVAAVIVAIGLLGCLGDDAKYKRGSFTDDRDGQTYTTTTINGQTWMAKNLNYLPETGNSWCYGDDNSNCNRYGRLYDWETAMAVCPYGWHLPTSAEWDKLINTVDGENYGYHAGQHLKSTSGFECSNRFPCEDDYGFSALPGGQRSLVTGTFDGLGTAGYWWEVRSGGDDVNAQRIFANANIVQRGVGVVAFSSKQYGNSVRCIQD